MTWKVGCLCGLFLIGCALHAANPGERPVRKSNNQEDANYADLLLSYAASISARYVREIPVNDIVVASVEGLYDAARATLSKEVAERLKNAKNEGELRELIIAARNQLGNNPALDGNRDMIASLRALTRVLDSHCTLAPSRTFATIYESNSGFGFELDGDDPNILNMMANAPLVPFRIGKVHPGSPAQRAGLRPRDILTHVNDTAVTVDRSVILHNLIFSRPDGSEDFDKHRFTVLREGRKEPIQFTVTRKNYVLESIFGVRRKEDNSWDHWLDSTGKIAYLRIGYIDRETPMQLRTGLTQVGDANGLILDLRWCPGGFLNQAAEVAGIFLETGVIASVKYRHPEELGQKEYRADSFGLDRFRYKDVPMLVLVNGETMGGGELVAAALQDNGRAKVAGQRTFGKGSVQTPMELIGFENIVLRLSAGTIVRPSGKNLQRFANSKRDEDWGVRPDKGFEIPSSESFSRRLKEWHQAYLLRPHESRESLPLDDPENDAPRILATKLLQRTLPSK